MDTRQLKTFRHLARTLNFSKTALALHYAQSTISAQIQSLENELRLTLFDRLGKKTILTEEGRSLLAFANRFRALEEEYLDSLQKGGSLSGTLNIYAPNSICIYSLPEILSKYRRLYPEVNFRLQAHLGTKEALENLRSGDLDLVLIMEKTFTDPDFTVTSLSDEEIIFISHPDHPLAQRQDLRLEDLKSQDFILTEPPCGYRAILTQEFLKLGQKLEPIMWFDNAEAIKKCVMSNMGIAYLPKMTVKDDIAAGLFTELKLTGAPEFKVTFQIILHKDKYINPELAEFIKSVTQGI